MSGEWTRRQWLAGTAALGGAGLVAGTPTADKPFGYMLNTATIMGQKLSLVEQIDVAARAGYDAIEPWIRDLEAYVVAGHSLRDAAKRLKDANLRVESAIGFAQWIVDDPTARKKGLEQAKRDMDLVLQLGGTRIAAPPTGATDRAMPNLFVVADRYRDLCEIGVKLGVIPQVELWGFSKSLSRLGETALVAIESAHPKACILADIYHLHKGGSGFTGLRQLSGNSLQVFHMNDYPANPPREKITDADRVFPGDGVAPLVEVLRDLKRVGFRGYLSLELFNRDYWKQDAFQVAKTGLARMKAVVERALVEG
ncbi:MAG: sugar phosphate isomerase/epimerase family protein [Gemmataceae bacterium]